jgi:hypothetical protein
MEGREEGQDQKYYTVTYHSEGHTEGEVPVDTYKYPINPPEFDPNKIYRDDELPFERPENGYATVMDQGTLKMVIDGIDRRFTHWAVFIGDNRVGFAFPGANILLHGNLDLYALWNYGH